jgi:hypothetical protein
MNVLCMQELKQCQPPYVHTHHMCMHTCVNAPLTYIHEDMHNDTSLKIRCHNDLNLY